MKCITCNENERLPKRRICNRCRFLDRKAKREVVGSHHWYQRKYQSLKCRAKVSGNVFNLLFEEFVTLYNTKICPYCEELILRKSVDRVDNSRGYDKQNCILACFECNNLKNDMSITQIKNIYQIAKEKGLL